MASVARAGVISLFSFMLRILTLNVQGFRNSYKQREVVHFARENFIDLVFLQEVNFLTNDDVKEFQRNFNVPSYFSLASNRSCGVGVLVFNHLIGASSFSSTDSEGRFLVFKFTLSGSRYKIINLYGPARVTASNNFLRALGVYLLERVPTILCGDFNCVLDSMRDVRGPGQGRPTWNARELGFLIQDFALEDVWLLLAGNAFSATWKRGSSMSRLDRFYVSQDLVPKISNIEVAQFPTMAGYISDHAPVLLSMFMGAYRPDGARHWRLDTRLLQDDPSLLSLKSDISSSLPAEIDIDEWDSLKSTWWRCAQILGKQKKLATRLTLTVICVVSELSAMMENYLH